LEKFKKISDFIGKTIENMSERHAMIDLVASVHDSIYEISY